MIHWRYRQIFVPPPASLFEGCSRVWGRMESSDIQEVFFYWNAINANNDKAIKILWFFFSLDYIRMQIRKRTNGNSIWKHPRPRNVWSRLHWLNTGPLPKGTWVIHYGGNEELSTVNITLNDSQAPSNYLKYSTYLWYF